MKISQTSLFAALFLLLISSWATAQSSEYVLNEKEQKRTIDSIGSYLNANYIFPKVAEEMQQLIQTNFKNDEYKTITDPREFANKLTEDLRSISKDLHLRVNYEPERIAESNNAISVEERAILEKRWAAELRRNNFGFKEVKILDGNIGYLDLRSFDPPEYGGETAVAAMNFLSNSDALIIDLRQNGGGSPMMIQLISSYLFDSEPVHLNTFYRRPSDEYSQTWTLPHVQGKRRPVIDVYVLTSRGTFSAAEEFSYNLKNLERATLIGETTGGGAHPGGPMNVTDKYSVWIPQGRAINPITNTNWEGTGVKPHIEIPAEDALLRAQMEAFGKLAKDAQDSSQADFYTWYAEGLKIKLDPPVIDETSILHYVGSYGPRIITSEDGTLFYQREGRTKYPLIPMGNHWFILDGLDSFRIEFLLENDRVVALVGHYDNGNEDKSTKN